MKKPTIAIFGLGAVGVRISYFLAKLDFNVVAFEKSDSLFENGGLSVTNLSHNSGVEYCRRLHKITPRESLETSTHVRTAELCIDGGIANALIYGGSHRVMTENISYRTNNPLQFLIAKETLNPSNWDDYQGFSIEDFESNTKYLRNYYQKRLEAISHWKDLSLKEVEKLLYGPSSLLGKRINNLEGLNEDVIAFGITDIGMPINQAYEYSLWHEAIERAKSDNLQVLFGQELKELRKGKNGRWIIETNDFQGEADFIFLTGSYGNPLIRSKIEGAKTGVSGVFYLNVMAYAKIKATDDSTLQRVCNRGYFTLQQDYGGMGVSIIPVTKQQDGYIAIYYPSNKYFGSQIRQLRYTPQSTCEQRLVSELKDWQSLMIHGLPSKLLDKHSSSIIQQAIKLYPFYQDAKISLDRIEVRSVFNADTKYGSGSYRNLRVLTHGTSVVNDSTIWELYGAKWTNAIITALQGVDKVLEFSGRERLPRSDGNLGFGLDQLDILSCVSIYGLHIKDIFPSVDVALQYCSRSKFPKEYVNIQAELFLK